MARNMELQPIALQEKRPQRRVGHAEGAGLDPRPVSGVERAADMCVLDATNAADPVGGKHEARLGVTAVSYTHLTLPTTPYV